MQRMASLVPTYIQT